MIRWHRAELINLGFLENGTIDGECDLGLPIRRGRGILAVSGHHRKASSRIRTATGSERRRRNYM